MSVNTPEKFSALLLPDSRATLLMSDSTYTEAGPQIGTPARVSGVDSLTVEASGSMDIEQQIRIKAASSGSRGGASFLWRHGGDPKSRGYNGATMIQNWAPLAYFDGTGSPVEATDPQAVALENGVIVLTFERQTTLFREVVTRKYTPSTDTWGSVTIVYQTTSTGANLNPALVVLPSGQLLCFHWVTTSAGAGAVNNIRAHFSLDSGGTWSIASMGALDAPIVVASHTVSKLRAVWSGVGISMVAELDGNKIIQFYSTDFGVSFNTLADQLPANYSPVLVDLSGTVGLLTVTTGAGGTPQLRKIGNISDPFGLVPAVEISSAVFGNAVAVDLAGWVDRAGDLFAVGRLVDSNSDIIGFRAAAPFDSWNHLGESSRTINGSKIGRIFGDGATGVYARGLAATFSGGRAFLFHSWTAPVTTTDNSIAVATLGGWSTVPMGSLDDSTHADKTAGFDTCYFPMTYPATASAWTATGSGTEALTGGELMLTKGGGSNGRYYSKVPAGAFADGLILNASFAVTQAGSVSVTRSGFVLTMADGTDDTTVEIRASSTAIRIYDTIAAAYIGGTISIDVAAGVNLLVYMKDTTIRTYYRAASGSEDVEFIAGPFGTLDKTGGGAANLVRFGRIANSAITSMVIKSVQFTTGVYVREPADTDATARGAVLPSYIAGGVSADMIGVAFTGDEHKIPVAHDYALDRALPLASPPSPRAGWRSTDETEATIAILFSDDKANVTELGGDLLGVHLEGINWSTGKIQGYNGSTWVDLATINTAADYDNLVYDRLGNIIRPANVSIGGGFWSDSNEWAGAHFKMIAALGGACRKISTNSAGEFVKNGARKRVSLTLEGVTGSETTGGALSNGEIWPARATVLIPLAGVDYSAIRILVTASQGTAAGYYEIGQIVAGPVLILADGDRYSWGRSVETMDGTTLHTSPNRIERASVDAPARRVIEFGWTDGVDRLNLGEEVATASATVGSLPVAAFGEAIHTIEGSLMANNGKKAALVYLPSVDRIGAGAVTTVTRRAGCVLVRAISNIRRDTVVGEELSDEIARASMVLEEII